LATSLKIDAALQRRVRALAERRRRSAHWIMLDAIAQYVEREEARERFVEEARASWDEFRETGRHLTAEEAEAWLATWGREDERPAPDCHP
jgi:predicted transcriptional regulator